MRMMCDDYLLEVGQPGLARASTSCAGSSRCSPATRCACATTVIDARPMASKPHVGLVQSRWEVRNQHDEPVMTMEGWGMFRRRPAA